MPRILLRCATSSVFLAVRPVADGERLSHTCLMKAVATVLVLLGAAAAAALAARASSSTAHEEVAGHRFEIPKDHLFDETIAWLPAPEKDSFVFLLTPNSDPNQIPDHRFLVEPLSRHCPGDASQMLRIACGSEKTSIDDSPPYEKRRSDLGSWASDLYSVRRGLGKRTEQSRQIAYCQRFDPNPSKPKVTNLCTTFWAYKGMMLQFSFDEEELPAMLTMKRDAMHLLDSWEVH
jgi:hypothetical protein